ncbi:glycosyltransferase [Pseudonocardia oroxyli]|uniref:Glycosyltransferase involved in cell wall bisynthesis n=1 Tax=Pseudonocardia oroxyli TaxID=366584 RepID=A0A1G7ZC75_PSEOR|nr:glycosyltransferase [Pseudonocardia oroxyli]SDH06298.1 Glycosyltransferase involved in cell wall bisynthesis [Pseudonocardia oroxyli]
MTTTAPGRPTSPFDLPALRRRLPAWAGPAALIALGVVVVVGAVGGAGAVVPLVAAPVAVSAAVVAVRRPTAAMVLMTVAEMANVSGAIALPVSAFQLTLLIGLLSIANALRRPENRARLARPALVIALLFAAYIGTQLLTSIGSQIPAASSEADTRMVIDCLFAVVVAVLAVLSRRPWTLAAAIVLPFAVLCVLAVVNQVVFAGTATFHGFATVTAASGEGVTTLRQSGPLNDSNFWGRHLVVALPMAAALLVRSRRARDARWSAVWIASLVCLLAGIYLTQSRGTFISAIVAIGVWVLLSGRRARLRAAAALPLAVPLVFLPGIGDRIVDLVADVQGGDAAYGADPSVLGRRAAQEIAWAIFRDRPLLGTGPGTYPYLVDSYAGKVGTAVLAPTNAPHNLYAELASDGGIVALIGWALFLGGVLVLCAAAVRRIARSTPLGAAAPDERYLAAAALAGLLAWSFASVFLHLSYLRAFGVFVALALCVAFTVPSNLPVRRPSPEPVVFVTALVALVVGGAAGAAVYSQQVQTTTIASQVITLLPGGPMTPYYNYTLDVRSRTPVLPTYGGMIGAGGDESVWTVSDPVRGVITVYAAEGDEPRARAVLSGALNAAGGTLRELTADRAYVIRPVGDAQIQVRRDVSIGGYALSGLALLAGCLLAWLALGPVRRKHGAGGTRVDDRIVLVEFSPSGGLFQFALQLGEALAAEGHRVELVTGPDPERGSRHPGLVVSPVLPTWHPAETGGLWGPLRKLRRLQRAAQLVAAWVVLADRLRRNPPRAVVWSHWRFTFEPMFVHVIARMLGGRSLLGIVAHEPLPRSDAKDTATPKDGKLLERAFRRAWQDMDVAFVLGEHTRAIVQEHWAPRCEVVVIPHGDEALLRGEAPVQAVARTGPEVLFFGTWSRYKGIDVLLEAFALVRADVPTARLVLAGGVGADVDLDQLLERAREIGGVDARPGYVDIADVPDLVGSSRFVVVPYVRASQSGVAHLAFTFGRPVVASAVGDIPAAVHHEVNGLLVPPSDAVALAAAMRRLLVDEELAARWGAAGRRAVEAEWQVAATRMVRALDAAEETALREDVHR